MVTDQYADVSALLASPDFFPLRVDLERRGAVFVQMSRETMRRSAFLDHRAVRAGPFVRLVDIDELLERLSAQVNNFPAHFILHGAFCGSTLLARYFEELPHTLVLKEPQLLAQLAYLSNVEPTATVGSRPWGDWFEAALKLLSRRDADIETVLIKAPDQFNCLANRLLDREHTGKIIFLAAPLRVFLLSVLKSDERRDWLRGRIRALRSHLARVPLREALVAEELTDGQLGAALWLLNAFLCMKLLKRPDSDRMLVMGSEELIHRPQDKFREAVEFLGLTRAEAVRSALEEFEPLNFYSKEAHRPIHFSAATRGAILSELDKRFSQEVDAAMAWATQMGAEWLSRSPFRVE